MKRLFILFLMLCLLPIPSNAERTIKVKNGNSIVTCDNSSGLLNKAMPSADRLAEELNQKHWSGLCKKLLVDVNAHYWDRNNKSWLQEDSFHKERLRNCRYVKMIHTTWFDKNGPDIVWDHCTYKNNRREPASRQYKLQSPIQYAVEGRKAAACTMLGSIEDVLREISTLSKAEQDKWDVRELVRFLLAVGYDLHEGLDAHACGLNFNSNWKKIKANYNPTGYVGAIVTGGYNGPAGSPSSSSQPSEPPTTTYRAGRNNTFNGAKIRGTAALKVQTLSNGVVRVKTTGEIWWDCDTKFYSPSNGPVEIDIKPGGKVSRLTENKTKALNPREKDDCNGTRIHKSIVDQDLYLSGEAILRGGDKGVEEDYISDFAVVIGCEKVVEPDPARQPHVWIRRNGRVTYGKERAATPEEHRACLKGLLSDKNNGGKEIVRRMEPDVIVNAANVDEVKMPKSCEKAGKAQNEGATRYSCLKPVKLTKMNGQRAKIDFSEGENEIVIEIASSGRIWIIKGRFVEGNGYDMPPSPPVPPFPPSENPMEREKKEMREKLHIISGPCVEADADGEKVTILLGGKKRYESHCPIEMELNGKKVGIRPDGDGLVVLEINEDGTWVKIKGIFYVPSTKKDDREESVSSDEVGQRVGGKSGGSLLGKGNKEGEGSGGGGNSGEGSGEGCDEDWPGGCADGISGWGGGDSGPTYFYKFKRDFTEMQGGF